MGKLITGILRDFEDNMQMRPGTGQGRRSSRLLLDSAQCDDIAGRSASVTESNLIPV